MVSNCISRILIELPIFFVSIYGLEKKDLNHSSNYFIKTKSQNLSSMKNDSNIIDSKTVRAYDIQIASITYILIFNFWKF